MASSPASSDLSEPPSAESDGEDRLSTAVPSSRPSVDITQIDHDHLAPPAKRRKTNNIHTHADRAASSVAPEDNDDIISLSSDGFSSAPASPTHDEYALRDEAQILCLWRDCDYGTAINNDELVKHVQGTHCATGGPKKTKYVCEWGECQRKNSNHPSGYALKAHMRSHTKEKPYYCALPECDKSFTRSDALAKHMRTVHEPEPAKIGPTTGTNDPTPPGKKTLKLKLSNGTSGANHGPSTPTSSTYDPSAPTHDEDGNPVSGPTGRMDNIVYNPAHHPITGQPGFMINYPQDITFTAWESSIPANSLMKLLRRQVHWATQEQEALKAENDKLEALRREEYNLKEVLLEGVMERDLARGDHEGLVKDVDARVLAAMAEDVGPAKARAWTGEDADGPEWRSRGGKGKQEEVDTGSSYLREFSRTTPPPREDTSASPSPPPTGHSAGGGFDGDQDPYDNYLAARMAEYDERERLRSLQNTPQKTQTQESKEADAVGALLGMSGK